jgi:hypothetical protein
MVQALLKAMSLAAKLERKRTRELQGYDDPERANQEKGEMLLDKALQL